MKKEKKPKKKLTSIERELKKQNIKKLILGFIHVISYILSFLFLIVCIIAACSGGCSPKKAHNNVTTPVNDNVPISSRAVEIGNYSQYYNVDNFVVGDTYHIYYDYKAQNIINADMLYRYCYANGLTSSAVVQSATWGQSNAKPGLYFPLQNIKVPGYSQNYLFALKGIGIVFESDLDIATIYIRYYHNGIMSHYNYPVYNDSYNNVSLSTGWNYINYVNEIGDNPSQDYCNSIFLGTCFEYSLYSSLSDKLFLKYFTLEYTKGFNVNFQTFYNDSLWKQLTGGAQVSPGIFGVSSSDSYLTSNIDVYGLFKYNNSLYNRIRFNKHIFSNGDKIAYRTGNDIGDLTEFTIGNAYDLYYTISSVEFQYIQGNPVVSSNVIYSRSTTFYVGLLQRSSNYYYMIETPNASYNNGVWAQIGFVDISSTSFNIYYDLGYTFYDFNLLSGMDFTTYLSSYYSHVDIYYYSIDLEGYITYYTPYDDSTPTGGDSTSNGYFTRLFNIFGLAFASVLPFFAIELVPGVSLGMLIFAPFFVTMILFVIKLFKR